MFSGGLKLSDDDDDFDLVPENAINNLSNIFGIKVENTQQNETPSLRYVSPKPPAKEPTVNSNTNDWKVQVAKVVTAYKLHNQENISQGKIGLAVLRNFDEMLRIILYRSKNNVLSTCTLKDETLIYRNNLYLQFHDDLQLFWSVLFESKDYDDVLSLIGSKVKTQPQPQLQNNSSREDPAEQEKRQSKENISLPQEENSSDDRLTEKKANILSRMARMGQPLPKIVTPTTTTDLSDSSEGESKLKVIQKPTIVSRKPKVQSLVPLTATNMQVIPTNALSNYVATSPLTIAAVQDSQYLNILLAENRTQNTELRMNISKLETKIEKVLDKMDILNSKTGDEKRDNKEDEILVLEERVLELKKDNRALKVQLQELHEQKHQTVSSQPAEDFDEFKKFLDEHKIDYHTNQSPVEICKQLIRNLRTNIEHLQSSLDELTQAAEASKSELIVAKTEFEESSKLHDDLQTKYQQDIDELRKELTVITSEKNSLAKQLQEVPNPEILVKEIMNNLYQRLTEEFDKKSNFTSAEMQKICAHAIKTETNNVIKRK